MHRFFVRVFSAAGPAAIGPLPVTFEAAMTALEQLPQMLVEPDGSFVWSSPAGVPPPWQVAGTLGDGGATLYFAELKGCCPPEILDQLLACLSPDAGKLMFEMVEQGVMLNASELHRGLTSPPDTPAPAPGPPG